MHLEKWIEKELVKFAKVNGIYTRKFTSPANRGVPDRIFIHVGKVVFLEIKAEGGRLSELQKYELKEIAKAGVEACPVFSLQQGIDVLKSIFQIK